WTMKIPEPPGLRVAFRLGLFTQAGAGATLAKLSPKRFNGLATMYHVVTEDGVKVIMPDGKQGRAPERHPDFVSSVLPRPAAPAPESNGKDTRTQGQEGCACARM